MQTDDKQYVVSGNILPDNTFVIKSNALFPDELKVLIQIFDLNGNPVANKETFASRE